MAAPRPKHSAGMNDAMMCDEQVHCWCCKALIVVPRVDGVPVDVFKVQDAVGTANLRSISAIAEASAQSCSGAQQLCLHSCYVGLEGR